MAITANNAAAANIQTGLQCHVRGRLTSAVEEIEANTRFSNPGRAS
jgi:hypothetical protein